MISTDSVNRFFRSLDREVWVVTSGDGNIGGGLLATWVMQASLSAERPILLAGIAPNHHTAQVIDRCGCLAAHLLRADQTELGLLMASASGHQVDKLAAVQTTPASDTVTAPVLAECYGWVAGPIFARLDAGDRIFYWAEISLVHPPKVNSGSPLRESQLIAAASDDVRQTLRNDRERDAALHAPLHDLWVKAVAQGQSHVTSQASER